MPDAPMPGLLRPEEEGDFARIAVVLAAGRGSRIGGPKATLLAPAAEGVHRLSDPAAPVQDTPAAAWWPLPVVHAERLMKAGAARVFIVTRAPLVELLMRRLHDNLGAASAERVDCLASDLPDAWGAAGSLRVAAHAIASLGAPPGAAFVVPCDVVPGSVSELARLVHQLENATTALAVKPSVDGRGGHPVVVRASVLAAFAGDPAAPPPTLRDVLARDASSLARMESQDPAFIKNLNDPTAYRAAFGVAPRFDALAPPSVALA